MNSAPARPSAALRLLRAGVAVLDAAGIESPRLDAQILLAAALGIPRFDLVLSMPASVAWITVWRSSAATTSRVFTRTARRLNASAV